MKNKITYRDPWYETDQDLTKQLELEIARNHILANKKVKTIARRNDNDDVLFKIQNNESTYAIVHLTWKQSKHTDSAWPRTRIFASLEEIQKQLDQDHIDWK